MTLVFEVLTLFLRRLAPAVQKVRRMKPTRILLLLAFVAASLGLSACNTMKGVGKDVERAGEKIQDNATR